MSESNSKTAKRADSKGLSLKNRTAAQDDSHGSLISEEEWKEREQRHLQRIHDVNVCLGFITESVEGYKLLLVEQSKAQKWNRYMACDGLPRVEYPAEIRTMIAEMHHFEAKAVGSLINWTLSVDEKSILLQDTSRVDRTRKTLEQLRPNIGQLYEEYIQRCLITLERIELLMEDEYAMADVTPDQAIEIASLRSELSQEIDVLFDKLTYRIVCAPTSFRTAFDGVSETYCYECPNYSLQIWWLSDVPIRFNYLELPLMLADMKCVGVTIQIPLSVLEDNLTIRCIHTLFDHYSESAKSFEQVIDIPMDTFNGGLMDIEDCLLNEWRMQVLIMNDSFTKMELQLMEYERKLRELEAQTAAAAKKQSENKPAFGIGKKKKTIENSASESKVKPLKEPDRWPQGWFPDPYNKFLEREQSEYEQFLEEFLSPENMHLRSHEINLRQFSILGGLFSLICVRKPKHTEFQKFNMTFHEDGRVLHTKHEVRADVTDEADNARAESRSTNMSLRQKAPHFNFEQAMLEPQNRNLQLNPDELPYFCLSFQLPEHLCLYGEPLACQFIEEDEVDEEEQVNVVTVELEEIGTKKKKGGRRPASKVDRNDTTAVGVRTKVKSPKRKSPETQAVLRRPTLSPFLPRRENPRNLYQPSMLSILRTSSSRPSTMPGVYVRNFSLTGRPLTNLQTHILHQHYMPRILSSFKFPLEFRKERSDELAEIAARGCKLLRRQPVIAKPEEMEQEDFSYDRQAGPERLFPVYDSYPRVLYDPDSSDGASSEADVKTQSEVSKGSAQKPDTMFGVLQTLQQIQQGYKAQPRKLWEQTNFGKKGTRLPTSMEIQESSIISKRKSAVRISMFGNRPVATKPARNSAPRSAETDLDAISVQSTESVRTSLKKSILVREVEPEPEPEYEERPKVKHWTTKYLKRTEFDQSTFTFKIQTDRLGIFGFAYKRYEHFPFRQWTLQYNEDNINEIVFKLDTYHVRVFLFITNEGIRGFVTKITDEYVAKPVKYMEITEPISDYRELRRRFCEKNVNIFAERDACFYIENGYFSEKHLATELHVYDALAIHCKLLKFYRSDWNRLATRRNIVLCMCNPKDAIAGVDVTVRVTPDNATFVEVSEPCSENLDTIKLDYQPTWRNIGVYSDMHQLINSMYPQATDVRNRDPKLIHYIRTLFTEVRPLSFS